jgi:RND family efflux transporter MFP subunit
MAADPPPDPLAAFRKLSPAERQRLLEKASEPAADLYTVKRGTVTQTVVERGSLEAEAVYEVYCRLKARTQGSTVASSIRWVIDDGTHVKKGDRLIELDDAALQDELLARTAARERNAALKAEAEENLALVHKENEIDIKLAELDVKFAEIELKKTVALTEARQVAELKVEQARLLLQRTRLRAKPKEAQAEADLRARTAAVELAAAAVRGLEHEMKDCIQFAPRDGLVVYPQTEPGRGAAGSIIAQGEPVRAGQKLLQVCNLSHMLVTARVHEAVISRVRSGQRAVVRVDAFPTKLFTGKVKQIAVVASQQDWLSRDVKVYPVVIALDEEFNGLRPTMSAEVRLQTGEQANVLSVPLQAILGKGRDCYCYVLTDKGVEERRLSVGIANEVVIEIREGLAEGDKVLLNPRLLLRLPDLRRGAAPRPTADVLVRSVRPQTEGEAVRRTRVVSYGLTLEDFEALARQPGVAALVPVRSFPAEVRRAERQQPSTVVATTEGFAEAAGLACESGRFLRPEDDALLNNVAVLSPTVAAKLFANEDPVGQTIRVGQAFFQVVGVLQGQSRPAAALSAAELDGAVFIPLKTCQARFGERVTIRQAGSVRNESVALSAILVRVDRSAQTAVAEHIRSVLEATHSTKDWDVQVLSTP